MNGLGTAVVVGTVGVDLVADSREAPLAVAATGNSGANIAVRLAALGWETTFVCLVGDDPLADLVEEGMRARGVRTGGIVRRAGYATPRIFQVLDPAAPSTDGGLLFECPRCGRPRGYALEAPSVEELSSDVLAAAAAADLVVADMVGPAAVRLMEAAPASALRWFEASMREAGEGDIVELASRVHVVKVSSDDADHYASALSSPSPTQRWRLRTAGAAGVDVQARRPGAPAADARVPGADGWGAWTRVSSALDRDPVDPIGAGDAFTATAATVLSAPGVDVLAAVQAGQQAAAEACLARGALGDLPPLVRFECARCYAEATTPGDRARG
jgi:sugar/nucleoside kinase (ribokinase family)